jgi:hypothetical protein
MAVNPFRVKTMAVTDFYFREDVGYRFPLGNLRLPGKLSSKRKRNQRNWPSGFSEMSSSEPFAGRERQEEREVWAAEPN